MMRFLPRPGLMLAMLVAACVFLFSSAATQSSHYSYAQEDPGAEPGDTPQGTPANMNLESTDEQGNRIRCDDIPEAKGGVFLGKIIPCLAKTIEKSSVRMSEKMIEWFTPIIWSFISFVFIMFGLKIVQGEGQIQAHGMLLLIRVTLVMGMLALIPHTFIPMLYGVMEESQEVVMSTLGPDEANLTCDISKYKDGNTPLIWAQMDCLIGKLYGFTTGKDPRTGEKRPNMLLASSMVGLLGGFFFGGTFGAAVFLACLGVLFTMFMLVLRVVMAFINAYLIIALYMIIAPLFMPLVFLRATGSYFEKWTAGILAGLIMPIVICAYVTLAMQLYDKMLFADDSLIQKIFKYDWVEQGMELPREACDRELTNNPAFRAEASGVAENEIYKSLWFFKPGLFSGGNNLCAGAKLPVFNLEATKDKDGKEDPNSDYGKAKAKFELLFKDCIKLFVLAWLIDAGFKTVIGAIRPVLGSGALAATLDATSPMEKRMQLAMNTARKGFIDSVGYNDQGRVASGKDFIARLPAAPGGALQGFMRGFSQGQD